MGKMGKFGSALRLRKISCFHDRKLIKQLSPQHAKYHLHLDISTHVWQKVCYFMTTRVIQKTLKHVRNTYFFFYVTLKEGRQDQRSPAAQVSKNYASEISWCRFRTQNKQAALRVPLTTEALFEFLLYENKVVTLANPYFDKGEKKKKSICNFLPHIPGVEEEISTSSESEENLHKETIWFVFSFLFRSKVKKTKKTKRGWYANNAVLAG